MPFLKTIIINDHNKIMFWEIILGELNHKELSNDEKILLKFFHHDLILYDLTLLKLFLKT